MYILAGGRIRRFSMYVYCSTPSSAEDIAISVRLNNTTDYVVTTTAHFNADKNSFAFDLNIPVVAGDYVEIKMVTPAFATNPLGVSLSGSLLIECE
jgi:hypothetical protein